MRALRCVLVLALVLAIAAPLMAQEKTRKKGEKRPKAEAREGFEVVPKQMLEGLDLSAEQKAKLEALQKQYGPKLNELRVKADGVLTEEQKKARAEAQRAAREAGKTPEEAKAAVQAAAQLTDEQKAKMAEIRKTMSELQKEVREKFMGVLTLEQQEAVKAKMKKERPEGKRRGDEGRQGGRKKAAE